MNFLERQLDDRTRFARIRRGFYVVLGVIALAEIVLQRIFQGGEHHFDFEGWLPAWGSLYGFASCVAIILVSKLIGKVWLMRRENYYDR